MKTTTNRGSSSMFRWDDAYLIGIDEIDNQHKKLFQLVADLEKAIDDDEPSDIIEVYADKLLGYAEEHFAQEEELFTHSNMYASAQQHISEHAEFRQRMVEQHSRLKGANQEQRQEVLEFLQAWLIQHVAYSDQEMADQIGTNKHH